MRNSWSMFLCCLFVSLLLSQGCLAPGAVRLANKPTFSSDAGVKNVRIALVVKDDRSQAMQKANMCGVNHQTAFFIPVAPLFLAHTEHLDAIVSHHVAEKLKSAGYTVTSAIPLDKQLSEAKVSLSDFDKETRKEAWSNRSAEAMTAEERKQIKAKKEGGGSDNLEEKTVSPWGEGLDVSSADYVLELKIKKFWTTYSYYGSYSWMTVNIALCKANDPLRTVLFGKKAYGVGYFFSFFTPLTPSSDATASFNLAYWQVMNEIEKQLRSTEIMQYINNQTTSISPNK